MTLVLLLSLLSMLVLCPTINAVSEKDKNDTTPTPLTDPSQAYIAPDFYTRSQKQTNLDLPPRNPPHIDYSEEALQKIEAILSDEDISRTVKAVENDANLLVRDKSTADKMQAIYERVEQDTDPIPSGHSAWGTGFDHSYMIKGGFAEQAISVNLDLGSTPDEDKTLYAPTITLPQPCPLEVSTRYWYYESSGYNGFEVRIFDFYEWKYGSGNGWTNVYFTMSDTEYIFDSATDRPYYYAEIQYWLDEDEWCAYFWNRNANNWELMYTQTHGYSDYLQQTRLVDGWDFFEVISPGGNGYDNSWAGVNIYNPVMSSDIMVYRGTTWYDATSSNGCYQFFVWTNTPFALTHAFATPYSDWYVRTPVVFLYAYDNMDFPVTADVWIDGDYAGTTNFAYYLNPNIMHTITIGYWGTSIYTYFYGGTEEFTYWFPYPPYNTSVSINAMTCGYDIERTAWYTWTDS
ncbi:MAG: hypothetical protein NWE95_07565 [Candidatus Bathyarchaeota archaeon]|nr:hypothetical protein [Candidatus Bathyarchaeota archaeon]